MVLMGKIVKSSGSEKLIQDHQEFKNGIPVNPNCVWDYKVLANFYHQVLEREIADMESASKGAKARQSDFGEDGGNGIDEYFFNTKMAEVEGLGAIKKDELIYAARIQYLLDLKEQISSGKFVCRCEYNVFYAKNIL